MKKYIVQIFTILILISNSLLGQNGWVQKANGPAKSRAGNFVIGNYGYYGAGNDTVVAEVSDWYRYDPSNDSWSSISNMPSGMQALESFSIGNKGYAGIGWASSSPKMNFYEYDPSNNSWATKASYPSGANPPSDAGSFVLNNEGYVLGGAIAYSNVTQSVCNKFNPTSNTWTAISSLPQNKQRTNGNSINGEGYAFCGLNPGLNTDTSCFKYNSITNSWSRIASLNGNTERYNSFVLNNNIYVITDSTSTGNTQYDFWSYDTLLNTWSQMPSRPFSGLVEATFVINNRVFVILSNGNVWEFTSLTGIAPPSNTNTVSVYPNPAHDHLQINVGDLASMSGYTIKITNTLGQIVFNSPANQQAFDINLNTWTGHGTYVLYILDQSQTVKSVKEIVLQ